MQPAQDCQIVADVFEYIQHDDGIEAFSPSGGGDIGFLYVDLVQPGRSLARGRDAVGVDVDGADGASGCGKKRREGARAAAHFQHVPSQVRLDLREDPAVVGAGRLQPVEPLILDPAFARAAHTDALPVRRGPPPRRGPYLRPSGRRPAATLAGALRPRPR